MDISQGIADRHELPQGQNKTKGKNKTQKKMTYTDKHIDQYGARLQATQFDNEWHVMLHIEQRGETFAQQLRRLYAVEDMLPQLPEFRGAQYVVKRYFLSDSTNQAPLMRRESDVALSFIQQQPLDGSKIAVWAYMVRGAAIGTENGMVVCSQGGYTHLWQMGMIHAEGDSGAQTEALLADYEKRLATFGATLADNCVRTWFFVRDVDTQYKGLVVARRDNFAAHGLTSSTHYIASTGIQGLPSDTNAIVQMAAYAIAGAWSPRQQRYLYAPTHLNRTSDYGVTFERGVCIEYGDRAHTIISGTASIDNKGSVVHPGDIVSQTHRMWQNVEALLRESGMDYDDVMHLIVYLRDTADYATVSQMFRQRFPNIPTIVVYAPVCRPGWLIEMECIAIASRHNPQYAGFATSKNCHEPQNLMS